MPWKPRATGSSYENGTTPGTVCVTCASLKLSGSVWIICGVSTVTLTGCPALATAVTVASVFLERWKSSTTALPLVTVATPLCAPRPAAVTVTVYVSKGRRGKTYWPALSVVVVCLLPSPLWATTAACTTGCCASSTTAPRIAPSVLAAAGARQSMVAIAATSAMHAKKYKKEKRMERPPPSKVAAKGREAGFGRLCYKGSANRRRTAGDVARQQRWGGGLRAQRQDAQRRSTVHGCRLSEPADHDEDEARDVYDGSAQVTGAEDRADAETIVRRERLFGQLTDRERCELQSDDDGDQPARRYRAHGIERGQQPIGAVELVADAFDDSARDEQRRHEQEAEGDVRERRLQRVAVQRAHRAEQVRGLDVQLQRVAQQRRDQRDRPDEQPADVPASHLILYG